MRAKFLTDYDMPRKINIRYIDAPCCGNCKYAERHCSDEYTVCINPKTSVEDIFLCPYDNQVCDLYEPRQGSKEAQHA